MNNLKLKASKCEFFHREVTNLGHAVHNNNFAFAIAPYPVWSLLHRNQNIAIYHISYYVV